MSGNGRHRKPEPVVTFGDALARIAGDLKLGAEAIELWARRDASTPTAQVNAYTAAADLSGAAALVRRAGSLLATVEREQ